MMMKIDVIAYKIQAMVEMDALLRVPTLDPVRR
jgi:hypothetical protein